jgi:hypothetical protein
MDSCVRKEKERKKIFGGIKLSKWENPENPPDNRFELRTAVTIANHETIILKSLKYGTFIL